MFAVDRHGMGQLMCEPTADPADVLAATPRPAPGDAVDPIGLAPVDEVEIVTLVDNTFDALLTGSDRVRRPARTGTDTVAPQFEGGRTVSGLVAEHGFAALVRVRRGDRTTTLLFDTGQSPDAMVRNADLLGVSFSDVHSVVLSHGHFDHTGGLAGLAGRRGVRALPMVVHPSCGRAAGWPCRAGNPRNCPPSAGGRSPVRATTWSNAGSPRCCWTTVC
ncbi:hypothetical protein GCM10029964_049150 [Kibdelosporangium lantanae]